jgi:cytochrome P450
MAPPARFRDLPMPPRDPYVGLLTGQAIEMRRDHHGLIHRTMLACGDYARLKLFWWDALLIACPTGALTVLQSDAAHYTKRTYGFRQVARVLGEGLFTAEGTGWRDNRVVLQPFFTKAALEDYGAKMRRHAEALAASVQPGPVDLTPEMVRLTLNILGDCVFGEDFGPVAPRVMDEFVTILDVVHKRVVHHLPLIGSTTRDEDRRFDASLERFNQVIEQLVAKSLADPAGAARSSMIQALLADEKTRDPANIRDQVITILFAGHETSAVALQWIFYLLSHHPDWRERVEAEVDAGTDELPVLRSVIQEALRLYPPVWILSRRIDEDVVIDGMAVKKGTMILVSPFAIHRNPRHWDRPDDFDPTRFSPENTAGREKGAYLPFGLGRRACIGANMAMLELTTVVSTLVRTLRFDFAPGQTARIDANLTLRPLGGMPMTCSRRTR